MTFYNFKNIIEGILLSCSDSFTRAQALVEVNNNSPHHISPNDVDAAIKRLLRSGKIQKEYKLFWGDSKTHYSIVKPTKSSIVKNCANKNNIPIKNIKCSSMKKSDFIGTPVIKETIKYNLGSSILEIPIQEGYELAEPEPRIPVFGVDSIIAMVDDYRHNISKQYDVVTPETDEGYNYSNWRLINIPIFGQKRFIVRKKEEFKCGEVVEVSINKDYWYKVIFIKKIKDCIWCLDEKQNLCENYINYRFRKIK